MVPFEGRGRQAEAWIREEGQTCAWPAKACLTEGKMAVNQTRMDLHNTIYRAGGGLPVVLIHAFPVDHRMWDRCAAELIDLCDRSGLDPFPVYAPDMPGAGGSPVPTAAQSGPLAADGAYTQALDLMADALVDLLRSTGASRAIWVGLSMGGYAVEAIWRRHPETVAGLALCDTAMKADAPESRSRRLAIADECLREGHVDPVMGFADVQEGDSTVKRSLWFIRELGGWIRSQDPGGVAWRERMAAGRPDQTHLAGTIDVPVAMVSGRCDPSANPDRMAPLMQAMDSCLVRFTAIPDCGHFSAVEYPSTVARALMDLVLTVKERDREMPGDPARVGGSMGPDRQADDRGAGR